MCALFCAAHGANKLKSVAEDDMRALFCAAQGANELKSVAEDDMRVRSDTLQRLER